jgi:hypothetical protein
MQLTALGLYAGAGLAVLVFLAPLVRRCLKPKCNHARYREERWVENGTLLMHTWKCYDCGLFERGHVYGGVDGWEGITDTRQNHDH